MDNVLINTKEKNPPVKGSQAPWAQWWIPSNGSRQIKAHLAWCVKLTQLIQILRDVEFMSSAEFWASHTRLILYENSNFKIKY